jgi:AraC family transcriptional regulator
MLRVHEEVDRVVFESNLVRIGAFRCHPEHPSFQDTGPAQNYCFVFPRTAVEIQHEHESAFVANPNVVTFYNAGQVYLRNPISPEGDRCDWFGVEHGLVRDALRRFDPGVDDRPERLFHFSRGWSDAQCYLLQRRLFSWVTSGNAVDPLAVDETVIELLDRVLRRTCTSRPSPHQQEIGRCQRHTVHEIETLLSQRLEDRLTLRGIAREVGFSAYHVCRLFRQATGIKLHQYRLRLRLREALTDVVDSRRSLTEIALDAGFSSHSHFTDIFRHEFSATPSYVRAHSPHNHWQSNFLIARATGVGVAELR